MNICPFFEGDFSNFISIFDYKILYIFLIKNTSNLHYAKFESIQLINWIDSSFEHPFWDVNVNVNF